MIFSINGMLKEDIEFLREYENNFNTAINNNYSRNIVKSKLLRMLDIYKRETGRDYNLCTHCSTSVLSFLKLIGRVYFDMVQKGNEPILEINKLPNAVTDMENNNVKKNKRNGKYTTSKM